jgi:DNA-binding IscR family transcriptional regulator
LVRGVSGRYGGYLLARPPADITIGQILEATLGPICVVDCIEDAELCPRSEFCECRVVYSLINRKVADVLEEYTLADLVEPSLVREMATTAEDTTYLPGALTRRQGPADDDSSSGH